RQRVWRIDGKGKAEVFVPASAFPSPPLSLSGIAVDPESGTLYVSDSGDAQGNGGAGYPVRPEGGVTAVTGAKPSPGLRRPGSLLLDGASHLLMADTGTGELHRIKLADGTV